MAILSNRSTSLFRRTSFVYFNRKAPLSYKQFIPKLKKGAFYIVGCAGVGSLALGAFATTVFASELTLHPPKLPWEHQKHLISSYDHSSIRRGYQVYKEVCAACHSIKFVCYRHLVNVCMTEDEAKALAAEQQIVDGPNDSGEMFERPGRLSDPHPKPYPNDEAARMANNGALPPDLTYIVLGRHGWENYLFHLLTGYVEAPAGVKLSEGQHYNPYFPGSAIGMARALYDDMIEYEDGTPATTSQMAKDVTTFLRWCADPYHDDNKRRFIKGSVVIGLMTLAAWYYKKKVFAPLNTTKFAYKNRPLPRKP